MFELIAFLMFGVGILAALVAPGAALAAAICVNPVETLLQTKVPFLAMHGAYVNYASGAIVLVAVFSSVLRGKVSLRKVTHVEYAIYAFYLLLVLSFGWTISRTWWISTVSYAAPYTIAYIFAYPSCLHGPKILKSA